MLTHKVANKTFFGTEQTQYKDHFCISCSVEISKKQKVISVIVTDGFRRKLAGIVCDEKCFRNLK